MTVQDFSNKFDVYLNSYWIQPAYGNEFSYQTVEINEAEKSVYLTRAQEEFVKGYYSSSGEYGYETTEEVRRYLQALVKTSTDLEAEPDSYTLKQGKVHQVFDLPKDVWDIVYEEAVFGESEDQCVSGKTVLVVPTTHDDFFKTVRNPFKGPNNNRVLRLDRGDNKVELVSNNTILYYHVRYLSRPTPIILAPLPNGVKINGKNEVMNCALDESTHETILQMAVAMAAQSKGLVKANNKEKD